MTGPSKKRGGRREPPGGAPAKGNVRLVCYVQPETRKLIDEEAERTGDTLGQVVDRLLFNVATNVASTEGRATSPHQEGQNTE